MLGILFHSGILPVCPLNYRGGSGCVGVEGGGPFFGTPYGESRSLFFVILASARNYFQFCNPTLLCTFQKVIIGTNNAVVIRI